MKKSSPLKTALAVVLFTVTCSAFAQKDAVEDKSKRPSPAETEKVTTTDKVTIAISYSAPSVKGREIWGSLVETDKVWRTGANEATTFEVNKDVLIDGQKLPAGKYSLFTIIPKEGDEVTIILNKEANQWGAFKYQENTDALRFKVKSTKVADVQEKLKFVVDKAGKVDFAWEKLRFSFNVKAA